MSVYPREKGCARQRLMLLVLNGLPFAWERERIARCGHTWSLGSLVQQAGSFGPTLIICKLLSHLLTRCVNYQIPYTAYFADFTEKTGAS